MQFKLNSAPLQNLKIFCNIIKKKALTGNQAQTPQSVHQHLTCCTTLIHKTPCKNYN